MDIFIKNTKKYSIMKGKKKKSENVGHSIIKKKKLLCNDFWCESITSQDAKLRS